MSGLEIVDYRTKIALEGLPKHLQKQLLDKIPAENQRILVDFFYDLVNRENASQNTKLTYSKNLLYLMRSVKHKPIKDINRDDILSYLHSLRRSLTSDPKQKWISTHNTRAVMYQKFFKWLAYPEQTARERQTPDIVKDIPLHKKKERTNIQAKDLWTPQEDAVFLAYCEDARLQFYHMLSLDTSGRPHELLALKIGDVKIKQAGERMYAEVEIGRGGKTKSRTVPMIISLPYFKALLASHPEPNNPNAYLFRSHNQGARYLNKPLVGTSLANLYGELKKKHFPKLLERPDIPPEEKNIIRELVQKPWHPYLRRHTSLTEKAKILNEYSLRLHAGWTKSSKMVEIYTHELGGESSAMLLEAYGIKPKENVMMNVLQPKICTNCKQPNKPDARFCANPSCQMVLTYDAYEEEKNKRAEMEDKVNWLVQAEMERQKLENHRKELEAKEKENTA